MQKCLVRYISGGLSRAKWQDCPCDCPLDCPMDVFYMEKFEQKCSGNFLKNTLPPGTSYLPFSGFFLRRGIRY